MLTLSALQLLLMPTDGSRLSTAIIHLCDSVCLRDKMKTAKTKIAKLALR